MEPSREQMVEHEIGIRLQAGVARAPRDPSRKQASSRAGVRHGGSLDHRYTDSNLGGTATRWTLILLRNNRC